MKTNRLFAVPSSPSEVGLRPVARKPVVRHKVPGIAVPKSTRSKVEKTKWPGFSVSKNSTGWSADGSKHAVASQEGAVAVWDVRSTRPLKVSAIPRARASATGLSDDRRSGATASRADPAGAHAASMTTSGITYEPVAANASSRGPEATLSLYFITVGAACSENHRGGGVKPVGGRHQPGRVFVFALSVGSHRGGHIGEEHCAGALASCGIAGASAAAVVPFCGVRRRLRTAWGGDGGFEAGRVSCGCFVHHPAAVGGARQHSQRGGDWAHHAVPMNGVYSGATHGVIVRSCGSLMRALSAPAAVGAPSASMIAWGSGTGHGAIVQSIKLEPYLVRFSAYSVKLWGFKVAAGANSAAGSGAAQNFAAAAAFEAAVAGL
ncbi:hypothetical protein B0H13DRAFT_1900349 [Mycena leptocephala]|nr:hypothetical protein B0H13DRAFT_1900349 [Mycena leptocephala]